MAGYSSCYFKIYEFHISLAYLASVVIYWQLSAVELLAIISFRFQSAHPYVLLISACKYEQQITATRCEWIDTPLQQASYVICVEVYMKARQTFLSEKFTRKHKKRMHL